MSLNSFRIFARACFASISLAAATLLCPAAALAEVSDDTIAVNVDQARLVKLPARVATIVVGNPLIADVALQAGGVIVVTGKGYGATNFIAMDRSGEVLVDRLIQVEGPTDQLKSMTAGSLLLKPGKTPHPPHQHPEEEFMVVTQGTGEISMDGKITKVGPGSMMYSAAQRLHGIVNTGKTPLLFYFYKWQA